MRDRITAVLAALALAVAILAMGGAPRWAQAVVALLLIGALAPTLWSRRGLQQISPLVAGLGIGLALTVLQLVPLPAALVAWLDPIGVGLRDDGAALLGTTSWQTITLDVPGTLRGFAYFAILLGVASIALRITPSSRGRFRVLAAVGLACGLVAAIVAIHQLLGAKQLYGFYAPHATPAVLGPLLNENHLGCLMAMGVTVNIGLAMHRAQRIWMRVLWLALVAACGATTVATHSRGATIALLVGSAVAAGVLVGQRLSPGATRPQGDRRKRFLASSLPIGVVAVCAIVMVVYSSASGIERQFAMTSMDEISRPRTKFAAWRSAAELIEDSPWVGVGRGAFEPAFTRVHPASGVQTFSHVENEYVQAVLDFGIPGTVLLALATLWLAVTAIRRWRDGPLAAGALGALAVVAVQSNIDFGLEMLGIAVPSTAIAATLAYVPIRKLEARLLWFARGRTLAQIAVLAVAATVLLSSATTSIEEDHVRLARTHARDDLRAAMARHPLDYYGYALSAEVMLRAHDGDAIRMLNHAMRLHPTQPGLHHLAARLLYQLGHVEQAGAEYGLALRATPDLAAMLGEIASSFSPAQAAAAIPTELPSPDAVVAILEGYGRADTAILWLGDILVAKPDDLRACELLYGVSMRQQNLHAAEVAARGCVQTRPDQHTRLVLARMLVERKAYSAALAYVADVESWTGMIDEKVGAWLAACDAHLGLDHFDAAKKCLRRLDVSGNINADQRPMIADRIAAVEKARQAASDTTPAPSSATPGSAPSSRPH